jgi:hypothetical protein
MFPIAQQPLVDLGFLIIEVSRSHSDTPHSVGLLCTSDQPEAGTSTLQHTSLRRGSHAPGGIVPTLSASERPQNHALGRSATGIKQVVTSDKLNRENAINNWKLTDNETTAKISASAYPSYKYFGLCL